MGLFGSKKTYVSSTLVNLAGPEVDRPSYLKTTVIGSVLGNRLSISDNLTRSYIAGPGIKLRRFVSWAENNYSYIGVPQSTIVTYSTISGDLFTGYVPSDPGEVPVVETVEIGLADYMKWATQWMINNHPTLIETAWSADYNESTNQITITFADTSTAAFTPTDFARSNQLYVYITYSVTKDGTTSSNGYVKGPFIYIYLVGSGVVAIDELVADSVEVGSVFYPMIPVRIENDSINAIGDDEAYELASTAFKKAINGDLDDLINTVETAPNVADIDYAYAAFGVSANVLDNSGKKYLYDFFEALIPKQSYTYAEYTAWKIQQDLYYASQDAFLTLYESELDSGEDFHDYHFGGRPNAEGRPATSIRIKSNGTLDINYDMEISWSVINPISGSGLYTPGARKGELSFDTAVDFVGPEQHLTATGALVGDSQIVNKVTLYWQTEDNSWDGLELIGFVHRNYIYNGKYVEITLADAVVDTTESGFLVPLDKNIYKDMSIVDYTQLSTSCCFLVLNSYLVKKPGLFGILLKILIIIVIIIVVVYAPQLAPSLANAALATGTTLGLTGVTALVVGAAVNAIVGMVLASILTKAAVAVFGEKWGAIIGAIASVLAMNAAGNVLQTGNLAINFGNVMSAANLIQFTTVAGNAYSQLLYADAMSFIRQREDLIKDFEAEANKIKQLTIENFGVNRGIIDPLELLDDKRFFVEGLDAFIDRTLMVGDIADISMNLIGNFTELTLSTKLPAIT